DYVSAPEAASLCRRVGALFENQGAAVQTYTHARGAGLDEDAALAQPEDGGLPMAARTELVLELRSRQVHKSKHPASWVLFAFSFTLLPGVTEQTFVQEVEIRDGEGFLLARDTLEGRLVRRVGAGTWAANKVLDWTVRPPEAELTGNAMQRDLSEDLYGRLSQLLFNARVQRQVLDERTREVR
ncbi:MAG: hypothetical protein VX265_11705, partial [Myxococcota bacterium]|nr:hypothetical protein [Myxococcota bacterium]